MENQEFTLRNVIARNKQNYMNPDGTIKSGWEEEGCAWAIQDYYSSRGSLMDFSEDDWAAAAEQGWTKEEVGLLCLGADYTDSMEHMQDSSTNDDPGFRRVMVKKYGYIILPGPDEAALEAVKNIKDSDVDWGDIETDDAEIVESCSEDGSI